MEVKTIEFTNWSGQYKSSPGIYAVPETAEDLKEIVRNKEKFPSPLVAIGSGHSNSGCNIVNGGTAVIMKKFNTIQEPLSNEVTAGGGVQLFELHRYLAQRQLQVPFTPEIGNATLGSVACCALKDAAIGQSSGIATGMIKAIRFIDADGNDRSMARGDAGWDMVTSSHGLFCIIYEVTLDVIPMQLVIQGYEFSNVYSSDWEKDYRRILSENDGIFGLLNASDGKITFETRNFSSMPGKPSKIENIYNSIDRGIFMYFNPLLGKVEANWYARIYRKTAMAGFHFMKASFRKGRRTFKSLKPIDYSDHYPWRWDFHFWAFPVRDYPTIVLPSFLKFLKDYKNSHPDFDEKALMACYRIRTEKNALLSPSYEGEMMTIDPVRPVTKDEKVMKSWDSFCNAYSDFAVQHGGTCTFNQTKVLTRQQVEKAFGMKWEAFKKAREVADPQNRFLSNYFSALMYGK
jgi:hypothetical protein